MSFFSSHVFYLVGYNNVAPTSEKSSLQICWVWTSLSRHTSDLVSAVNLTELLD